MHCVNRRQFLHLFSGQAECPVAAAWYGCLKTATKRSKFSAMASTQKDKERVKWLLGITGGYVKQTTAKVLKILMAQDPASAKSKFLFLIPPHIC